MPAITIVDESTLGKQRTWSLDIFEETISLRELLRRRIYQEVSEYNARPTDQFHGLVQPTATERILNGEHRKPPRELDWEAHYEKAITAFSRHGFIVLVDDRQVNDLDASIQLHLGSEVTFLKLVPLVGG